MAEGGLVGPGPGPDWSDSESGEQQQTSWEDWQDNLQEQRDEVMALEAIYGEAGPVHVVSRPTEDDKGVFSLEIEVKVSLPKDGIMVEMWVPYDQHNALPARRAMTQVPAHNRPNFMRTESGRQWHSAFLVHHLSPLSLYITLPHQYPSDVAPVFTLSCLWLDAGQLSDLCKQLDQRWDEALGMPVMYTWADWLQESVLSCLHLDKSVILTPYLDGDDATLGPRDPRALPECSDVEADLIRLMEYDCGKQWEDFKKGVHECSVCFCEYPGNQFYVIDECQHRCCSDCMTDLCVMHVTEGTVQQLKCPLTECKLSVPPGVLHKVLGEESYTRWERLCLQKALETMEDVTWCPRCNSAVIRDSDETQAFCTNCQYSFCPRCQEPYHSKSPCMSVEQQMERIEQQTKKLAEDLNIAVSEVKGMTDSDALRLSREKLRRLKQEFLSTAYLKKEAKQCPSCKVPIEKSGGCNKVTCSQCGQGMCWICMKKINSYDHFNADGTKCNLFPGQDGAGDRLNWNFRLNQRRPRPEGANAVEEAIMAGRAAVIAVCPRCRQRNLRNGTNNHIKCWSCKGNFCYQCKHGITGNISSHYTAVTPCNQHGDT